jgi:hypothetical protein
MSFTKVTNTNEGGWRRERDIYIQMLSASRLKLLNTLYTNSLKLIDSRGHVTADAQKRPKLSHSRSCPALYDLYISECKVQRRHCRRAGRKGSACFNNVINRYKY